MHARFVKAVMRTTGPASSRLDPSGKLRLIAPNFRTQPLRLPDSVEEIILDRNTLENWEATHVCDDLSVPFLQQMISRIVLALHLLQRKFC